MSTKRTCPAVLVVKGSAAGPLQDFSSRNNFLVPITTETKDFLPEPMYYLLWNRPAILEGGHWIILGNRAIRIQVRMIFRSMITEIVGAMKGKFFENGQNFLTLSSLCPLPSCYALDLGKAIAWVPLLMFDKWQVWDGSCTQCRR